MADQNATAKPSQDSEAKLRANLSPQERRQIDPALSVAKLVRAARHGSTKVCLRSQTRGFRAWSDWWRAERPGRLTPLARFAGLGRS
jgi:hypothetical protein